MKALVLNFIPDEWEMILQITVTEESRKAVNALSSDEIDYWTKIFFEKLITELEKVTGPICEGAVERIQKMGEDEGIFISEDLKLVSKGNSLSLFKKHEGCLDLIENL